MWLRFNGSGISPSIQTSTRAMLRAMARGATSFFDDAQRRAAHWLAAWDAQGIHRTATAGDAAGAEWLAREAAPLGAAVSIEEFALDRLHPSPPFSKSAARASPASRCSTRPQPIRRGVAGRL